MCAVRHATAQPHSHSPRLYLLDWKWSCASSAYCMCIVHAFFGPATLLLHLIFNEEPGARLDLCKQVLEHLANSTQSHQKGRKSRTQNYLKTYKHLNIHETASHLHHGCTFSTKCNFAFKFQMPIAEKCVAVCSVRLGAQP